jgi:hypothetical protein
MKLRNFCPSSNKKNHVPISNHTIDHGYDNAEKRGDRWDKDNRNYNVAFKIG